ncbi:major histocompatibility complex class I-related gene protein-like [Mugil cephalus]|uniref:major histocompatibility complex class I-related gene protein-like n=1 Tax=Mugil cephalus TaxID=48193 RepID=UPI001FB6BA34|nr:major histocompatibility complex class I-related gene protein-like [Mugil cephalus]
MKTLLLLLLSTHVSALVKHSLKYYSFGSSGLPNLSEFVFSTWVDDIQAVYCDRDLKIVKPQQDWMRKVFENDTRQMDWYNEQCTERKPFFKATMYTLKQLFNQSEGVHILQLIEGCEWDETSGNVTASMRFGYDGEDFIELDYKMLTWTALKPEADFTKQRWNDERVRIKQNEKFLTHVCPEWLKMYFSFGRSSLMRTDVPSVSLLQKTPSSPVSCHATGFYPDRAVMFWRKDGEEIHEGVEHGEILPNHDGSFQMNVDLDISSVSPEDWRRYDCVFHLSGVEDDIITKLDETQIRTNWVETPSDKTSITIIITFIIIIIIAVVVFLFVAKKYNWCKKLCKNHPFNHIDFVHVDLKG